MEAFFSHSSSSQGYSHIKANKECQDCSGCFCNSDMAIAIVADGHGSSDYPRTALGSKFAVEVALSSIKSFVETLLGDESLLPITDEEESSLFSNLEKNLLSQWHSRVEEHLRKNPITEYDLVNVTDKYKDKYLVEKKYEKAYGTTLIISCITKQFWFGIQVGDGRCVVFSTNGDVSEPIELDSRCHGNITTSICDDDALLEFHHYFSKQDIPVAVFVGTDGIDDSFSSIQELYLMYLSMMKILCENGKTVFSKEVDSYLPELSKRGSGDDVSLACAVSWKKLQQRNKQGIIQRKWKIADNQYSLEQLKAKSNEVLLRKEYFKSINDSDGFHNLEQEEKELSVKLSSQKAMFETIINTKQRKKKHRRRKK